MTQIIIKTGLFNYNPLLLILAHCAMIKNEKVKALASNLASRISLKLKIIQSPGISNKLRTFDLDNENTLDSTTDGIISLTFKNWNNDKNENPNHAIQKLLDSLFAESSSEYKEQLRTFLQSLNQNKSNSESESLTFHAYHICRAKDKNLKNRHAHEIDRILEGLENYLKYQELSKDYFITYMIANKNDFFIGFRTD